MPSSFFMVKNNYANNTKKEFYYFVVMGYELVEGDKVYMSRLFWK